MISGTKVSRSIHPKRNETKRNANAVTFAELRNKGQPKHTRIHQRNLSIDRRTIPDKRTLAHVEPRRWQRRRRRRRRKGQSSVKQATNRKRLNRGAGQRNCAIYIVENAISLTLISIRSELSCAPISLKVSYSRGIEFHTAHSPGVERNSTPSNFLSGSPMGTDIGAVCKGQTPVLFVYNPIVTGKGRFNKIQRKEEREREREREIEGTEETLSR